MPGPEAKLQAQILKYLRSRPGSFTRKLAMGPFSGRGIPDILHIEQGRPLLVEVKAPGGKATPLQIQCLRELHAAGAVAFVAWSLEDVKARLGG